MKKGDIIYGRKKSDAIHPIVYLKDRDENFFIGAMVTKSDNHRDNILMDVRHFRDVNENGEHYEFQFNNTHLVRAKLLKKNEWQPFRKIGELTKEGIKFVESEIESQNSRLWEDYLQEQ